MHINKSKMNGIGFLGSFLICSVRNKVKKTTERQVFTMIYSLGDKRMLCWDTFAAEKMENVRVLVHKPEKKELAVKAEGAWDGVHNSYASLVCEKDGTLRFYMRSYADRYREDGMLEPCDGAVFSLYESRDGKHFTPCPVDRFDYHGIRENNIFHMEKDRWIDNFSVFYDENPACPPEERYKALSSMDNGAGKEPTLLLYVSADGVEFHKKTVLPLEGRFDSFNVLFWDKSSEQYFIYYRDFHLPGTTERSPAEKLGSSIRDIRVATSKDLIHFEEYGMIRFPEGTEDIQLYTNQIAKYPRAEDMFLGFPVQYIDRKDDQENFRDMPGYDLRSSVIRDYGRSGTALTNTLIMTSRDGFHFKRRDEAYLKPVKERNWWYGECYTAYGLAETESDIPGAPNEISFYSDENYRVENVNFRRYTVRLDGFFSWNADAKGGSVLTKPFTFEGDKLELNFETGAAGYLRITLTDEEGKPIEGYKSGDLFGDAVGRKIRFQGDLASLAGKPVRLLFEMKDCDLYAYKFINQL